MFDLFANALAFDILGLDPISRTGSAVHFFIMDVAKIFILLVVVIYIMGLLRALVAPRKCEHLYAVVLTGRRGASHGGTAGCRHAVLFMFFSTAFHRLR